MGIIKKYKKYYKTISKKMVFLLSLLIITACTTSPYSFLLGKMIDEAFYNKNMKTFLLISTAYVLLFIFNTTLFYIININWAKTNSKFTFTLKVDMLKKVLSFNAKRFLNIKTGDVIERIEQDSNNIVGFIYWKIFYGIVNVFQFISCLYFVVLINWKLAVLFTILAPTIVLLSKVTYKITKKHQAKLADESGKFNSWLYEILAKFSEIRLLGACSTVKDDLIQKNKNLFKVRFKIAGINITSSIINNFIILVGQMSMYAFSLYMIINGELTLGGFVACITYFSDCMDIFRAIYNKFVTSPSMFVSMNRVNEILEETECEDYQSGCYNYKIKTGNIEFAKVSFAYENDQNILTDVSIKINSSETIAVIGHSGAGKSTLINLLCRLYDPNKGNIYFDGINIKEFNLNDFRNQIGIIHQSILLFNESLRYNLIFSNDTKNDEIIFEKLKMVELYDYVKSLKDGLNTVIGENGFHLSGGQKQRIAIARLFIKNPKIVIFDEATSALDSESEKVVLDSWNEIKMKRTVILISHRLNTVLTADRIVLLKHGKVIGFDTHEMLLQKCNEYYRLCEKWNLV